MMSAIFYMVVIKTAQKSIKKWQFQDWMGTERVLKYSSNLVIIIT